MSQGVGAADVGRRVVVRYRLPDGRATDVLGELVSADSGVLIVRRDAGAAAALGALVPVAARDVVASRVVPPRPPRRRSPSTPP